jgi:hypothetical protein
VLMSRCGFGVAVRDAGREWGGLRDGAGFGIVDDEGDIFGNGALLLLDLY